MNATVEICPTRPDPERIERLERAAMQLRRDVVNTVYAAKDGHPAPCMSAADLVAALYFDILHLDPARPGWMDRDRFLLSKGHACPVMYAALARLGFFPPAALKTLRALDSILQGHPDMRKTPGVDATSGSLGHGLSQGIGLALAARRRGSGSMTFVMTGDGELGEGIVWEAAMAAAKFRLANLVAIVDNNGMQSGGRVETVGGVTQLAAKWAAFGWHVVEIDGHDMAQVLTALDAATANGRASTEGVPTVILAHTVKGKGVPYMEGDNSWHKRVPTDEEHRIAMSLLGGLDLE